MLVVLGLIRNQGAILSYFIAGERIEESRLTGACAVAVRLVFSLALAVVGATIVGRALLD